MDNLILVLCSIAGVLLPHSIGRRYLRSLGVELTWDARKTALIRWLLMVPLSVAVSIAFIASPHLSHAVPIALFMSSLIALAAIDAETMYLPDLLTWPLLVGGIVYHLSTGQWKDAVIGSASALAVMYALTYGYFALRRKEGLGLGDAKLLGAIGAWLGWVALPTVLVVSAVVQILALLCVQRFSHRPAVALPYGPALAFAGIVSTLQL